MPPKRNNRNQAADDELDRKFEEKQKLLEKLSNPADSVSKKEGADSVENDDGDDDKSTTTKANVFDKMKAVEQKEQQIKQQNKLNAAKAAAAHSAAKAEKKSQKSKGKEVQSEQAKEENPTSAAAAADVSEEVEENQESSDEDAVYVSSSSDDDDDRKAKPKQEAKTSAKTEKQEKQSAKSKKEKKEKEPKKQEGGAAKPHEEEMFKSKDTDDSHCDVRIVLFILLGIVLMVVFKTYGEKYSRQTTVSPGANLYTVLESEYSASHAELKKSYRRLSLLWHPDKNPNCGDKCREKFYSINSAWKVLGNAEQREQYDSSHGILEMIKSKAILLDESNYETMVSQSTDVWIIQIFLNGDNACLRMSSFWEGVINKYGHIVKFGRIDAEKDYRLVSRLPFSAPIFPTFFSTSYHSEPTLLSFASRDIEAELAKFVQKSVENHITIMKKEEVKQHAKSIFEYQKDKKIDIIYLFSQDRIPIEYKYTALMNHHQFNFFTNAYGQAKEIEAGLRTRSNFIVVMNDDVKKERVRHEFNLGKTFNADRFYRILNYLNFRVTPELGKENFKQYCRHSKVAENEQANTSSDYNNDDENNSNADYSSNQGDLQTLCVILFKQSPHYSKQLEIVDEYRKNYRSQSIGKFLTGERMFENYNHVQFAVVDLEKHWRFKAVVEAFVSDPKREHAGSAASNSTATTLPLAIAFMEENKKISAISDILEFEDWLLDLQDNSIDFEYLNLVINDETDISSLFYFSADTPFKLLLKSIRATVVDFKFILAILIGFPTLLFKKDAHFAFVWTTVLSISYILGFSALETYQDFLYSK